MRTPAAILLTAAALVAAARAQAPSDAVCPSGVPRAKTHHTLVVGPATMTKAGGNGTWPALAYNGSIVGPLLRAVDGEDVTIDVVNTLSEGEGEMSAGWFCLHSVRTHWAATLHQGRREGRGREDSAARERACDAGQVACERSTLDVPTRRQCTGVVVFPQITQAHTHHSIPQAPPSTGTASTCPTRPGRTAWMG